MSNPQAPDKPRLPNPYLVGTAPVGDGVENAPAAVEAPKSKPAKRGKK